MDTLTVKDLKAIVAEEGVDVASKARKADLIAAIKAHRAAAVARAEREAAGSVEDHFLFPTTVAQLAEIKAGAIVVEGRKARKNRDALGAMNLKGLAKGTDDVAIHRVRKEVLKAVKPFGFNPKAHGEITESRGSLDVTTDSVEALIALSNDLRRAAQQAWLAKGRGWSVDAQQALLYAGRAYVHACHLEAAQAAR